MIYNGCVLKVCLLKITCQNCISIFERLIAAILAPLLFFVIFAVVFISVVLKCIAHRQALANASTGIVPTTVPSSEPHFVNIGQTTPVVLPLEQNTHCGQGGGVTHGVIAPLPQVAHQQHQPMMNNIHQTQGHTVQPPTAINVTNYMCIAMSLTV